MDWRLFSLNTLNGAKTVREILFEVAKITSAKMADVIGKIRDLGSNFRHETALAGCCRPCNFREVFPERYT